MATSDGRTPGATQQFLSFRIGETTFGLPLQKVREILPFHGATRVPNPGAFRGVMNVRGAVVPVVDLRETFGGRERVGSARTAVLIVELRGSGEPLTLGLIAEEVSEVLELGEDQIAPPPTAGLEMNLDHFTGLGKVGSGFVLLLDLDRLMRGSGATRAATPPTPRARC